MQPLPPEDQALVTDLYDSSIAYTDEMLHRLFGTLRSLDLEGETLVILTSDHGEALGEHGLAGHGSLYDHNLLVPLVFALPGGRGAGSRVGRQVRSIDVLPTVLEVLGLPPAPGIDGVSLVPFLEGKEAAVPREATSYSSRSNYGLALRLDERFKYIFQNNPWPKQAAEELYDLARDPGEASNLAVGSPQLPALRAKAKTLLGGDLPGLRLRFVNRSASSLCGTFRGLELEVTTVKVLEPDATAPCRFEGLHALRCCVPSGEGLDLLVEDVTSEEISLDGVVGKEEDEGGVTFHLRGTREELAEPRTWSLEAPSDLIFWWQGPTGDAPALEPEIDDALLRQLEALGYIE